MRKGRNQWIHNAKRRIDWIESITRKLDWCIAEHTWLGRIKTETPSATNVASGGRRTEVHVSFFAPPCRNRKSVAVKRICCKIWRDMTGFHTYSSPFEGMKKRKEQQCEWMIKWVPGISSRLFFCSLLGRPKWQEPEHRALACSRYSLVHILPTSSSKSA
jgi:hypothetical protein